MVLIAALRDVLGEHAVLAAPADRLAFETDWRRLYHYPALCVVLPETAAQVAEVIKLCGAAGVSIVPQGGNTGLVAGGVPSASGNQVVLSLSRMRRIRDIDTVSDTITVEAGVTLQAVQEEAAARRRLFPVSLGAEGTAQIGGVISTNAGGMQVLSYGSMRAQVLGLEVVLPDGTIWDGLRRLRKDNTGFDLKQMFIGAEGTLGVITAACLKLYPAVTAQVTALVGVDSTAGALKLFQALRAQAGAALTLCEFMFGPAMTLAAAHVPAGRAPFAAPAYVLLELSAHGAGETIAATLEAVLAPALEDGIATDALVAQSGRERADFLRLREAIAEGELKEGGAVKHDISVPLGAIPEMVAASERMLSAKYPDCRLNIFGHLGDGNLHVNIRPPAGQTLADLADRKAAMTMDVENLAVALGGSFSAEHGIGQMRLEGMRAHKSSVELGLMRALKQAIDPKVVLNP
ncbi:MAG TPA: FAD-binding oxidoreductase, partial [Acidocella sp.]|nr:FAD-binding oxidoreductase [Acidocella sp.]